MNQVKADLERYKKLKVERVKLLAKIDSITMQYQEVNREIELYLSLIGEVEKKNLKLEKENEHLKDEVEKGFKMARGYKELAIKKEKQILKYKKFQGLATFKLAELILVEALFVGVIIGVLQISK